MVRLLKKKFQFIVALVLGLVAPGLLCPFYYFVPDNSHNQSKQTSAYDLQSHFHSEVLEAYVHLIAHPADPQKDSKLHQAHSSRGHMQDYVDFCNVQRNVRPLKSNLVVKHIDFPVCLEVSSPLFSHSVLFEVPTFKSSQFQQAYSSRSPPFYLI